MIIVALCVAGAYPCWGQPTLLFPLQPNTAYKCTQGNNTGDHIKNLGDDLDFNVTGDAGEVRAAAGGTAYIHAGNGLSGCHRFCVGGTSAGEECTTEAECPAGACRSGNFGLHVTVDHGLVGDGTSDHYLTVYAHLASTAITNGQNVTAGGILGTADNSGFSCGEHLHFGLHRGDPTSDAIVSRSVPIRALLAREVVAGIGSTRFLTGKEVRCGVSSIHYDYVSPWMEIQAPGPAPRESHAMAFDSRLQQTVMFGGVKTVRGSPSTPYEDTWLFDGTTWRTGAASGAHPSPRWSHKMAYDSARGVTVLFGGTFNNAFDTPTPVYDDTWIFDGASWTQLAIPGPQPRGHHAMAFDSDRNLIVLQGGRVGSFFPGPIPRSGSAVYDDTWVFDGTSWSPISDVGPGERCFHAAAYDPVRHMTILFGGSTWNGTIFGDTWVFDGTAWAKIAAPGPSPRIFPTMAFDSKRQATVLFGGNDGTNDLNDTWYFDGTRWMPAEVFGHAPSPRAGQAMVYDSRSGASILFGGLVDQREYLNDTWSFIPLAVTPNP